MNYIYKLMFTLSFIFYASLYANDFKTQKVLSNLDVIWGMAFIDEKNMIINERDGDIFLFNTKSKSLIKLENIPNISAYGQGGLLDVQISPNYKNDPWIYFTYSKDIENEGVTVLARAKLKSGRFYSWEELLVTKSSTDTGAHFGSRITFDDNGYLYFSVGDRGDRSNGQNINTHASTIIRLHLDGSVPKDNPFVGRDGLDEIYSYGHRNPQGLFYDKNTKVLFSTEHGPRGGDEINIIKKGKNYGWATISYGKEYISRRQVGIGTHKEGMEQPIKQYTPSIAPSSLMVYSGKLFKEFKGDLFIGALAHRHLNRIILDKNLNVVREKRLLEGLGERIRNVIESPEGFIYLSTDSGDIIKLYK